MPEPCSPGAWRVEHVMGTVISIDARDGSLARSDLDNIFAWFRRVDDVFSTYQANSQISRLGRGEIAVGDCDPEVGWVLDRCEDCRLATDGYFETGVLDPLGLVKGWSVEVASAMLVDLGSGNHCINAGGDVRIRGAPEPGRSWNVGIVHPLVPVRLTVVVVGRDLAVATSGIAERGLHVVNPVSGQAADVLASVTLIGRDLTTTDAYATAALAMGLDAPDWLRGLDDHEAYLIDAGGHVWWTDGFPHPAPALRSGRTPPGRSPARH